MARYGAYFWMVWIFFHLLGTNPGLSAEDKSNLCQKPIAPESVKVKCKNKGHLLECTAKCRKKRTAFPDGLEKQIYTCNAIEGGWAEGFVIPECQEICDPPCQNQGKCSNKKCICTPDFRGPTCQYAVSLCDPISSLEFVGISHCNHSSFETVCSFDCPKDTTFQYPPGDLYTCSVEGIWNPSKIPNCVPEYTFLPKSDNPFPSRDSIITVESERKTSGVCAAWGRSHFRTFDGLLYSFRGPCTYLLARECSTSSFSIHFKVDPACQEDRCQKYITIYIGKVRYDLENDEGQIIMKRGEERLSIPGSFEGLQLERPAEYLIVRSSSGFRLTWDGGQTILLSVNDNLKNKTCGLCGQYDGTTFNDFQVLDGKVVTQVATFVNSWKMNELEEKCPDSVNEEYICSFNTAEDKKIAERADIECKVIWKEEYSSCHSLVNPEPYFKACTKEYCACKSPHNNCKCNTLAEYFRECIRLGGKIHGGWRNKDVCPLNCSVGMEYTDCGSSCPKTCIKTEYDCEDEHCVDGCHCPSGTALYEGNCIPEYQCPCEHSNKKYKSGDSIIKDCNTCECQGGNWKCTEKKCEARCISAGDPHYTTFDGTKYEFMGTCSYYLVHNVNFSIIQNNENCQTSGLLTKNDAPYGDKASCTKSLTINYKNTKVIFKHGFQVSVNGKDINDFPFSNKDVNIMRGTSLMLDILNLITLIWDGKNRVYVDANASLRNSLKGLCGTFNSNQKDDFLTPDGNIEIDVNKFAAKWKTDSLCTEELQNIDTKDSCDINPQKKETSENLCSLLKSDIFQDCHDEVDPDPFYNDCLYDMCACAVEAKDCLCPSLANYAAICAKKKKKISWREQIPLCKIQCEGIQSYQESINPCELSCKSFSMKETCINKNIEGCACPEGKTLDFNGMCINIINCPCIFEDKEYAPNATTINGNRKCKCKNAKWECQKFEKYTDATELENLMMSDTGIFCDSSLHLEYSDCLDCPITCENYFIPHMSSCVPASCRQGCRCEEGYILEDLFSQKCVKRIECSCTHDGNKYPNGASRKRDCNTCICQSGQWICEEKTCPGFCSSWGGSHFKTFDGHLYEFQGDCEYVLAESLTDSNDINYFRIVIKNEECGTSGITCTKTVKFFLSNSIKVILSENEQLPKPTYGSRLLVRKVGLYIFVYSNIGIILQWDRKSRVSIQANPSWRGKLNGLCGNFNDDGLDDFITPAGGIIEARAVVFGHSWRVYESCPYPLDIKDPCTASRKQFAVTQCNILKSDIFKPCHLAVPLNPYFERCVSDTCACDKGGDCECLCTAISTYAYECNIQGIYIKWRTQDLCPIQCEECGKYEPCLSTCPKVTCETKFLYSGLNDLCINEPCVDGCEPKPCPYGQIYNNDEEFKCIAEEDCKISCKEINGVVYYEGERIEDPSVGDGCQTCYCRHGNITCIGKPCTPALPFCYKEGWTEWMNTLPTITGDYELIKDLKIPCSTDKVKDIECRAVGTGISSKSATSMSIQKISCESTIGLTCHNADQLNGKCDDYEIRVFCNCYHFSTTEILVTPSAIPEIPKCTSPGWTFWMNSQTPNLDGEVEDITTLRRFYKFCPDSEISDVQCRVASNKIDSEFVNEDVQCTKEGLICKTSSAEVKCSDYEIRFYCLCQNSECIDPRGMEKGEILNSQIRVSSFSGKNNKGRLNSEFFWKSKLNKTMEWIEIDLDEVQNITGIITQGNPFADEWVTSYIVLFGNDKFYFTEILDDDGKSKIFVGNNDRNSSVTQFFPEKLRAKFIRVYPQSWHNWISLRLELLGCNVKVPTITTSSTISTMPVTSAKACQPGWTDFYDTDYPSTDTEGDTENITLIKARYSICEGGIISDIQCVAKIGNKLVNYTETGDIGLKCSKNTGFVCINFLQRKTRQCHNYQIRLYCNCGETTQVTEVSSEQTTFSTTEYPVKTCTEGWTQYFNTNNPKEGEGDFELLSDLIAEYKFCDVHQVTDIECKAQISNTGLKSKYEKLTEVDWTKSGDVVNCSKTEGLVCFNNLQGKGRKCKDYAVRFYCQCEKIGPIFVPNGCGWTSWFNIDKPRKEKGDEGDIETIEVLQKDHNLCQKPDLKFIECRDANSLNDYRETGQNNLVCDKDVGFKCYNKYQHEECFDYEFRVYCYYDWCLSTLKETETTATSIETLIPELTTSLCPPNEIYDECAYNCESICLSFLVDMQEFKLCTDDVYCVSGCRPQINCKHPYAWRDSRTCVHLSECTCKLPSGEILSPGSSITLECEKCQCYNNTLRCETMPNCGSTISSGEFYFCSNSSMGIEKGTISINQITVSSELVPATKDRIRLNTLATNGQANGGWASSYVDRDQFIQIDFLRPENLTGVITQGENNLNNWVTEYYIKYSMDEILWKSVVDYNGKIKKFKGNFDSETAVANYFPHIIEARFLKIIPFSWNNWISMRIEVLGCVSIYKTTIIEEIKGYSMPTLAPRACMEKMGFEKHVLPTNLITVSSSRSSHSDSSRIALKTKSDKHGTGGWVAAQHDLNPLIEIDFGNLRNLSGIITQGQQDDDNWVTEYLVQYSTDKIKWIDLKSDINKNKVFKGNNDRDGEVANWFSKTIEAQYLRIKPISYHGSSFAMRLEVIGCPIKTEISTPSTILIDYCPELPEFLKERCPDSCSSGKVCDGISCIDEIDCPCFIEGKKFEANVIHETSDCRDCICSFGNSQCHHKICPPCPKNHKKEIKENCECICTLCSEGTLLCPTSGDCIDEDRWCDGIPDCPDDENEICTYTSTKPPEIIGTTTSAPTPCTPIIGEYSAMCELSTVYFSTFDGTEFKYDICNHILFREKQNQNYIVKIMKDCSEKTGNCRRYIELKVDGYDLRMGPGLNIEFRGKIIPKDKLWLLSKRFKKFKISEIGETIKFVSLIHGFEIIWSKNNNVKIKVSKCLLHQVNGLCGLYNNKREDDFEKVDGTIAETSQIFGDNWSFDSSEHCFKTSCSPEIMNEAKEICQNLKHSIFEKCNNTINKIKQEELCLASACECLQSSKASLCLCQILEDFIQTCEKQIDTSIENWRVDYNCAPECPPGLEWRDCGPSCELTCDNFQQKDSLCHQECVAGCFCPPGLLRQGDICIKAEKCHDCICTGHGDPNYITFDEQVYAFQGMCTYVLARHKFHNNLRDFEIHGINIECPEEPGTSCTAGLIVYFNDNVVKIYRGKSVTINGHPLASDEYPYYAEGINITANPGKSALVYISRINLVVRYFESNYGFAIELPSKLYYNSTEGLCGVCNFIKNDDFYHRDGYIEENINDFASSWFVNSGIETEDYCREKIKEPPNPNPEICIFTENECDMYIDPSPYIKSCENDVGYSQNQSSSVCHSKLQYAQKCCEKGIILDDWLAENGCLVPCQENMIFQCTSHCQYSCYNYKAIEQLCEVPPEYQCSCPEGQVLKNGNCVDPIYCELCDTEGHRMGDEWSSDECTICECTPELEVHCKPKNCPSPPECAINETLAIVSKTTCCTLFDCAIARTLCDLECKEDEEFLIDLCICKPKGKCIYKHEFKLENGIQIPTISDENSVTYKVSQKWIDGLCKNCTCKDDKGQVTAYCQTESCSIPEESNDYIYEQKILPGVCCPKYERTYCKEGDKQYKIGEEWSLDEKCIRYKCINGSSGAEKMKQEYNCTTTCPPNSRYIEPSKHSDICCGHCEPFACEENGKIYQIGEHWPSEIKKCFEAECIKLGDKIQTVYTSLCKSNIENCPKHLIVPDITGCCQVCQTDCRPKSISPEKTERLFEIEGKDCFNIYPVENLKACSGLCEPEMQYDINDDSFHGSCRCCVAKETIEVPIEFECRDGSTLIKQYNQPESCECTKCKGLITSQGFTEKIPSK